MKNLERLPHLIMGAVVYHLTITAWQSEWTVSYEYGGGSTLVFGEIFARGETIEAAIDEMIDMFENHKSFEPFRYLLQN